MDSQVSYNLYRPVTGTRVPFPFPIHSFVPRFLDMLCLTCPLLLGPPPLLIIWWVVSSLLAAYSYTLSELFTDRQTNRQIAYLLSPTRNGARDDDGDVGGNEHEHEHERAWEGFWGSKGRGWATLLQFLFKMMVHKYAIGSTSTFVS